LGGMCGGRETILTSDTRTERREAFPSGTLQRVASHRGGARNGRHFKWGHDVPALGRAATGGSPL